MSQNVLFKERTALDFIEYAEEAAAWIKKSRRKREVCLTSERQAAA